MYKSFSLTGVISLALLSAAICQCNMVTMMAATPADHCTPAEEGDAPVEQCCLTQAAKVESVELTVPTPAVHTAVLWAETVASSKIGSQLSSGEILHLPPGRESLTHQICVLLI